MIMRITKHAGKPHIILYKRDDGSETWMHADDYLVRHDLSHYAIEKILAYPRAFMGMLNEGMEIRDFENREKRGRLNITKEAWYAENMANLFLIEIGQGCFEDFNKVSIPSFHAMNRSIPPPVLTDEEVDQIRTCLKQLLHAWAILPTEETMQLTFEL